MNRKLFLSRLIFLWILGIALCSSPLIDARAASPRQGKTLVLYDAASNALPSESLMDFTDFPPGAASLVFSDGATVLDTTGSGSDTFAGWVSGQAITSGFPSLDRAAGFQVKFTLQVVSEAHNRDHRAGFSIIILDKNAQGIELSFWENEIWAQNDDRTDKLFTHGEGATFAATEMTEYQVSIAGDTYTLTANSQPILSGPVRDYSSFDGFPDPYETPNFLFWGDDTTAAEASVKLRFASVTGTESVLPIFTTTDTSIPLPAATATLLPSATPLPLPTPTPAGNVFKICSSAWVLLSMAFGSVIFSNRIRRRYRKHS